MSGTSVDGVDVALVEIAGSGLTTEIELKVFETIPYTPEIRARIFDLFSVETARVDEICEMNFVLGRLFAESTLAVLEKSGVSPSHVESHRFTRPNDSPHAVRLNTCDTPNW